MGVDFSKNIDKSLFKVIEQNNQNKTSAIQVNNNESIFGIQKLNGVSSTSVVFDNHGNTIEDFANYSESFDIPYGHSRYEWNGAAIDIYRKDDDYQSQFVHPDDISREEFDKHFPYLEPVRPAEDETPTSSTNVNGINGEIDENTIQGSTGDCFLISALYSMCNSEAGKNIIKDSIKVNDDNTVTVTFKGIGVSYTLTADEINQFDTDNNTSDAYSNGDNDVLAMEVAVQKLWKDINNGRVQLNAQDENLLYAGNGSGINNGGLPSQLLYYLTGVEPTQLYNDDLSDLSQNQVYSQLQKAYESGNYSLTFGLYGNGHNAKLTNGENFNLDLGEGGHALAITDVQKDTVTFVNPWDTSKKYTMTWSEFSKLGIGYMSASDLTKTNNASEIKDMTDSSNYIHKDETDYGGGSSYKPHHNDYGYDDYSSDYKSFDILDFFDELIKEIIYSKGKKKSKEKVAKK